MPADTVDPSHVEPSSFGIISERNMFNPNRPNGPTKPSVAAEKPIQIESFSLVGTLRSEDGIYAFFDGSGSQYRKVLKLNEVIAGYRLTEITYNRVTLVSPGAQIQMPLGVPMRREGDGEWKLSTELAGGATSPSVRANLNSEEPSGNAASELEKKLIQRRQQE